MRPASPAPLALVFILGLVASEAAAQSGVLEGQLVLGAEPARKTVSRYPAGTTVARGMQAVPAVVYLTGPALASDSVPAGSDSACTVELLQRDTAFAPSAVAIRAGTVVRFPNADPFFHNVFSYAPNARFDLGRYPEGQSRQVVFREAGVARVFCEVHEFMRAVVLVTDHPYHAVVAEDGSFRITGVPPGEHTFVAYHADLGMLEQRIVLREGETVRLALALGS